MKISDKGISVYLYEEKEKAEFESLFWKSLVDFARAGEISLPNDIRVAREAGKKPRISPECGVYFSISHTKGVWACAFAREEVGLDIEKIRSCDRILIAKRFFHPAEAELIRKMETLFFDVWTAKESFVKYTGSGIDETFGTFSVAGKNGLAETVEGATLMPLRYREEYRICVCAKEKQRVTLRINQ